MSGEYDSYTREGLEHKAQSQAARIAELEAERAAFRAVLEGAEYCDLDDIAKQDPDLNRLLGMEVKRLTVNHINRAKKARNDALREAALLCTGDEERPSPISPANLRRMPAHEQFAYEAKRLAWVDADNILALIKEPTT